MNNNNSIIIKKQAKKVGQNDQKLMLLLQLCTETTDLRNKMANLTKKSKSIESYWSQVGCLVSATQKVAQLSDDLLRMEENEQKKMMNNNSDDIMSGWEEKFENKN